MNKLKYFIGVSTTILLLCGGISSCDTSSNPKLKSTSGKVSKASVPVSVDSIPHKTSWESLKLKGEVKECKTSVLGFNSVGELYPQGRPTVQEFNRDGNMTSEMRESMEEDGISVITHHFNKYGVNTHSIIKEKVVHSKKVNFTVKEEYFYDNGLLVKVVNSEYGSPFLISRFSYDSLNRVKKHSQVYLRDMRSLMVKKGETIVNRYTYNGNITNVVQSWTDFDDELIEITYNDKGLVIRHKSHTPKSEAKMTYISKYSYKYDEQGNWIEKTHRSTILDSDDVSVIKDRQMDWDLKEIISREIEYFQ